MYTDGLEEKLFIYFFFFTSDTQVSDNSNPTIFWNHGEILR